MVPTLAIGQRVLTNRLINHPSVGDIVVFHPPQGADPITPVCASPNQGAGHLQACDTPTPGESSQTFIKRVVGGPGDRIQIINGHVIRNGVAEKDSYIEPCGTDPSCNFRTPIVIPPGDYFMMGDNRGASDDSRFWGPVPDKWVIGVAFFTYWPPDRIGFL
jgi:signal peptidase I